MSRCVLYLHACIVPFGRQQLMEDHAVGFSAMSQWRCLLASEACAGMQGSYLLANRSSWSAMFWNSLPGPVFWPMFAVATLAAIIASQAMISAVFQIVKQAIVQGFFPRFHVYHTSRKVGNTSASFFWQALPSQVIL